jgi:hypothetical protein
MVHAVSVGWGSGVAEDHQSIMIGEDTPPKP